MRLALILFLFSESSNKKKPHLDMAWLVASLLTDCVPVSQGRAHLWSPDSGKCKGALWSKNNQQNVPLQKTAGTELSGHVCMCLLGARPTPTNMVLSPHIVMGFDQFRVTQPWNLQFMIIKSQKKPFSFLIETVELYAEPHVLRFVVLILSQIDVLK